MNEPSTGAAGDAAPALRLEWVVVLRGCAALWVLSFHLWSLLGGKSLTYGFAHGFTFGLRSLFAAGYQGVDLFFVLSGFVIAWPYVDTGRQRLDRFQVADFYQRRYFRIAPIFYVTVVVVVVLIHLHWLQGLRSVAAIAAHFLFAENFRAEWVGSLRAVYWTLPTEIHFYLLFPLLLRIVRIDRPLRFAAACLAFSIGWRVFTASMTLDHGVAIAWTSAYLPGRIDQFACGIAAACLLARRDLDRGVARRDVLVAGLLAVGGLVWIGRHAGALDAWFAVGPSLAAVLIAVFIVALGRYMRARGDASAAPSGLAARVALRLGEASLGIYLWHTVFLDLAAHYALVRGFSEGKRAALLVASVPVTLLVSLWTYRVVEARWVALSRSAAWRAKVRGFVARRWPPRTATPPEPA
ncbi:MAG: acyltransferase [Proteobacteria bacterium]|nr:acyltransferase [Pseudomonadota bacterium]